MLTSCSRMSFSNCLRSWPRFSTVEILWKLRMVWAISSSAMLSSEASRMWEVDRIGVSNRNLDSRLTCPVSSSIGLPTCLPSTQPASSNSRAMAPAIRVCRVRAAQTSASNSLEGMATTMDNSSPGRDSRGSLMPYQLRPSRVNWLMPLWLSGCRAWSTTSPGSLSCDEPASSWPEAFRMAMRLPGVCFSSASWAPRSVTVTSMPRTVPAFSLARCDRVMPVSWVVKNT